MWKGLHLCSPHEYAIRPARRVFLSGTGTTVDETRTQDPGLSRRGETMHKPVVLAVAGGSASGKSTFAQRLAQSLDGLSVRVMNMDRYFRKEKPVAVGPLSGRQWPDYNQPDSFHLDQLLSDLDQAQEEVVIVEGLMALWSEPLRERSDLKLFVDASADERIVRRLRRNMAERGLSFDEIADYYLDSVRFRHNEFVEPTRWQADLIINGTRLSEQAIEAVACWIRAAVKAQREETG
jgi:uridine kinase